MKNIIAMFIGVLLIYSYGMNTGILFSIAYSLANIADILHNKFPIK